VAYLLNAASDAARRTTVQRRNFPTQTRTDHVQDMLGFYVYRGRRYENNDIFPEMRADTAR